MKIFFLAFAAVIISIITLMIFIYIAIGPPNNDNSQSWLLSINMIFTALIAVAALHTSYTSLKATEINEGMLASQRSLYQPDIELNENAVNITTPEAKNGPRIKIKIDVINRTKRGCQIKEMSISLTSLTSEQEIYSHTLSAGAHNIEHSIDIDNYEDIAIISVASREIFDIPADKITRITFDCVGLELLRGVANIILVTLDNKKHIVEANVPT